MDITKISLIPVLLLLSAGLQWFGCNERELNGSRHAGIPTDAASNSEGEDVDAAVSGVDEGGGKDSAVVDAAVSGIDEGGSRDSAVLPDADCNPEVEHCDGAVTGTEHSGSEEGGSEHAAVASDAGSVSEPEYFDLAVTCRSEPSDHCNGSPENPCPIAYLEFFPDGTAHKLYDDIMMDGVYEIVANVITVEMAATNDVFSYKLSDDQLKLLNDDNAVVMECHYDD